MMERLGHRLAAREDLAKIATVPDYPFMGPDLEDGPTVSFVGKGNYRWPPPSEPEFCGESVNDQPDSYLDYLERGHSVEEILEESRRVGQRFRLERVPGYYSGKLDSHTSEGPYTGYDSPWWRFIVEMSIGLTTGLDHRPEYREFRSEVSEALRSVHTTNLFKVSKVEANPTDGLPSLQLEEDVNGILRTEFEEADPDLVLFPIGTSYPKSRPLLLPGWEEVQELGFPGAEAWEVTWNGFDGDALVTWHPQGQYGTKEYLGAVYDWAHSKVA